MTQGGRTSEPQRTQPLLRMVLAGVIGQVGCLTLLIIMAALLGGLWLDNHFQTRPLFVLLLVLGSIPLTLVMMFRVALSLTAKFRAMSDSSAQPRPDEVQPSGQA